MNIPERRCYNEPGAQMLVTGCVGDTRHGHVSVLMLMSGCSRIWQPQAFKCKASSQFHCVEEDQTAGLHALS
eukprot:1159677-Pelagomonas_calceolata.AAC.1